LRDWLRSARLVWSRQPVAPMMMATMANAPPASSRTIQKIFHDAQRASWDIFRMVRLLAAGIGHGGHHHRRDGLAAPHESRRAQPDRAKTGMAHFHFKRYLRHVTDAERLIELRFDTTRPPLTRPKRSPG